MTAALKSITLGLAGALLWLSPFAPAQAGSATSDTPVDDPHWVASWGAAPVTAGPALPPRTIRQVIRTSLGGTAVRIRLSNLFGGSPLVVGSVRVARSADGPAIQAGTDRSVSFDGMAQVTLPPGGSVLSDAVALPVAALESLAISLYLPEGASAPTVHQVGNQTVYLAQGDLTSQLRFEPEGEADDTRYLLTDLEVAAEVDARGLVVLGDSITDGVGSSENANARWPDRLAERLQATPATRAIAVVNAGIAGNRILNDAVAPYRGPSSSSRLDRDVLAKPGVRWLLLLQGGNDISASDLLDAPDQKVSAAQIIEGMQAIIARARARGIEVWAPPCCHEAAPPFRRRRPQPRAPNGMR